MAMHLTVIIIEETTYLITYLLTNELTH